MRFHRSVARVAALSLTAIGLGAGLAALGTPASAASGTYAGASGFTINTRTPSFTNTTVSTISTLVAGPASVYPSQIVVAGQPGLITDVNVSLNVTHTWPDDLDVMLVGPSGQRVILMSDAGGSGDVSGVDLTFNDGSTAISDIGPLVAGTYGPADYEAGEVWPAPAPSSVGATTTLSTLNGDSPNGTWKLFVNDDAASDGGSINSWGLTVTTDLALPVAATPYPGTVTVSGALNGITDVNVVLTGYTHPTPDDVDMMLVGPGGQRAMIMSDVGGGFDVSAVNLTLDDQAATSLPDSTQIASGSFQPANIGAADTAFPAPAPDITGAGSPLAVYNGTNPNGVWSLYVVDDGSAANGSITGWSLQISTVDAPAAPVITAPVSGGRDQDGVLTVAGSAPAGSTVTVREGSTVKGTAATSAVGQWAVAVSGLANGSHTLTATASDALGNVSGASTGVVVIVDSVKPGIARTVPVNKAKKVSRTANIKAVANEALRSGTVTKRNVFLQVAGSAAKVKAKVSYKAGTRTIVLNPAAALKAGTKYRVTVTTAVKDLAGNGLDQNASKSGLQKKTWTFTTR